MKAEQYDDIADLTQDLQTVADAREIAQAMRAPITAEALKADGWHETYKTEQYGGIWEFGPAEEYDNTCLWAYSVECNLDGTFKRLVDSHNRTIEGVATMYDLRELVRLLGGSNG